MTTTITECDHFTGRIREICTGAALMPIQKINTYRRNWGLKPLPDDGRNVPSISGPVIVRSTAIPKTKACGKCGRTAKQPAAPIVIPETGPGWQLIQQWAKLGVPPCQACKDLAAQMDQWGVPGCRDRLTDIVDDILPRAKAWVQTKQPWIHAMLPGIIEDVALRFKIRKDVTAAIDAAESVVRRIAAEKAAKPTKSCCGNKSSRTFHYPDALSPIMPAALESPVRHLTFHLWPVSHFGAWQWNCDQLLAHAELFNGRRIVAIARSAEADLPDAVMDYLRDFTTEFIVVDNNSKLREVATWIPMLRRLEAYQSDLDVTFSAHGKCVRHNIAVDEDGSNIFRWTKAMYDTCLHWGVVRPLLETHGTVGSFRRFGTAAPGSWGPWHYSGTFFWWRNKYAFQRDWKTLPQRFYGTEAWPGLIFRPEESAVIFSDHTGDLYKSETWQPLIPKLTQWREEHGQG